MSERLLADGHEVVGLDAFIPYYPRALKEDNLRTVRRAGPRSPFTDWTCAERSARGAGQRGRSSIWRRRQGCCAVGTSSTAT
ncbi:MAG: hypothetical protein R2851_25825 [Caldilineaceae bacterium]